MLDGSRFPNQHLRPPTDPILVSWIGKLSLSCTLECAFLSFSETRVVIEEGSSLQSSGGRALLSGNVAMMTVLWLKTHLFLDKHIQIRIKVGNRSSDLEAITCFVGFAAGPSWFFAP